MLKNLFLIGPANVGKTTIGARLAKILNYKFIDVDKQFCEQIELIPNVVRSQGYRSYCEKNSELVQQLIKENIRSTVFATPSGYLVHEDFPDLIEKNLEVIKGGISVLLLPNEDPLVVVD